MKRSRRQMVVLVGLLAAALSGAGCGDVPVHNVSQSFAMEVRQIAENQGKIQLDFLWLIDNTASMAQEQVALSRSFTMFREQLEKYLGNIDIQLAVTTFNGMKECGKFVYNPAETYPPAAYEMRLWPCLGDSDCEKKYGKNWECKSYPAAEMYNKNGSINSQCTYRCSEDSACCEEFCEDDFSDECKGKGASCLEGMCKDAPNEDCTYLCKTPGSGTSGCLLPPETGGCPKSGPKVLTMENLDQFKCNATVEAMQNYQNNIEMGLRAAWCALNPEGPNAEQSAGFLRKDAYLVIVFVTDEDDCSIDADFGAPNHECESDADCVECGGKCLKDEYYSELESKKAGAKVTKKLCYGCVRKDYYNICALLGEFRGTTHHNCVYDITCSDCQMDEDCDYGWECKKVGEVSTGGGSKKAITKCRPSMFGLTSIALYKSPPGAPISSLTPVSEYYSLFRSLKADPAKVMVASILGDGIVRKSDKDSLISEACLKDTKLPACVEYAEMKKGAPKECLDNPSAAGCEEFYEVKLSCIRDCYVASKGNPAQPKVAKNSYVCVTDWGKADYGKRYIQLTDMFGPNGVISNVCSELGIAPALDTIAQLIIKRVTKVCLPQPVKKGEQVVVTLTEPGKEPRVLTLGDGPGQFKYETTSDCPVTHQAVTFNDLLEPGTRIEVKYEASLAEEADVVE